MINRVKTVSAPAFKVLYVIKHQGGGVLTNADLTQMTGIKSETTITKAVRELARHGYVRRERTGDGRRYTYSYISEEQ